MANKTFTREQARQRSEEQARQRLRRLKAVVVLIPNYSLCTRCKEIKQDKKFITPTKCNRC